MLSTSWLKSSLKSLGALQPIFWELFTTDTISLQDMQKFPCTRSWIKIHRNFQVQNCIKAIYNHIIFSMQLVNPWKFPRTRLDQTYLQASIFTMLLVNPRKFPCTRLEESTYLNAWKFPCIRLELKSSIFPMPLVNPWKFPCERVEQTETEFFFFYGE